jgi:hypothetical protein
MKYVLMIAGLVLIAGAAGSSDFYDQCKAAADCVAGDPPSTFGIILQSLLGLFLLWIGVAKTLEDA